MRSSQGFEEVGHAIRRSRERARLSQVELASRARIDFTTLSKIERGKQDVKVSTLRALADALGEHLELDGIMPQPVPDFHAAFDGIDVTVTLGVQAESRTLALITIADALKSAGLDVRLTTRLATRPAAPAAAEKPAPALFAAIQEQLDLIREEVRDLRRVVEGRAKPPLKGKRSA